jgi:pyruvate dehydrogenase E1 component alpha subunit
MIQNRKSFRFLTQPYKNFSNLGAKKIRRIGMELTKEELLKMYETMQRIRKFELQVSKSFAEVIVQGFVHLYVGQEAVAAGVCAALENRDFIASNHRGHGHIIAKGADIKYMMAELCGRATGYCKGKGGSMHMFDPQHHFLGGHGIVGGGMPLAAGIGYAIDYRQAMGHENSDQVCVCFFGDGAVNEGAFHESLNIVALWKLPVIYVLENNLYGMGTAVDRASSIPDLLKRAACFDIERERDDGMDILAVREVADRAIYRARKHGEPRFIEAITYRYRGHSMADPGTYRTKDEIEEWRRRDPIISFEGKLKAEGVLTDSDVEQIRQDVENEVNEAVKFADESPLPSIESLYEDVYA